MSTRATGALPVCALVVWALALIGSAGCASVQRASHSSAYRGGGADTVSEVHYEQTRYDSASTGVEEAAPAPSGGPTVEVDVASLAHRSSRPLYARASSTPPAAAVEPEPPADTRALTDAVDPATPLLIYTAQLHLAVYEVNETQEALVDAARGLGGFVFTRADDRLVLRVPAARFHEALALIEGVGQVEHREVQAQDVSEEYHDVGIRIRTLEIMRQRVEQLLATATSVEDALAVERELQRITGELEHLRGRMRFLSDRIALSTITVLFRARPRESLDQPDIFELPFAWLDQLGLGNLLQLRRGYR